MRVVVQRVKKASVQIEGTTKAEIGKGLLVLAGFEEQDSREDLEWMVRKVINLRVFDDSQGVMNLSLMQAEGELLVVSQFTLHASTRKGNRPSYIKAAHPDVAIPLYEKFCQMLEDHSRIQVQTGVFGAQMDVSLINDGPVTIIIDSKIRE
ncbi:MAG: D-tyrosyl-tRNA(Tyr) deacylase [Bacteroidales bacterium]|nr:D-tyrosyl-tRNA(Tyr) deacylase [Bacteroidales bacterium]